MEETGCEIIYDAPTILAVKKQMRREMRERVTHVSLIICGQIRKEAEGQPIKTLTVRSTSQNRRQSEY